MSGQRCGLGRLAEMFAALMFAQWVEARAEINGPMIVVTWAVRKSGLWAMNPAASMEALQAARLVVCKANVSAVVSVGEWVAWSVAVRAAQSVGLLVCESVVLKADMWAGAGLRGLDSGTMRWVARQNAPRLGRRLP